ncbi:YjjG family noncanonical pyrimidine nucleotidase [Rapidithrix thailandica]|uniref:YjjG family noncanonical pyrimidine nucleotidase n=1 Tax=Rapidithrix thailandica TaxID=413964 RepID=A0AAW9S479_9BACT
MNVHRHLFFDLDHTLWDFERSSTETLSELFYEYEIGSLRKITFEEFLVSFKKINSELWHLYDHNQITKDYLRNKRFHLIFDHLGIDPKLVPSNMSQIYLARCPQKPYLIEHSLEVLEHLSQNYMLHIVTNGFKEVQGVKLKSANISHYFNCVITSECSGHKKPSKEIFTYALELTGAQLKEAVMIGDNLATDIKGAQAAGMDCIFFNPERIAHNEKLFKEITTLIELKNIY